MTEDTFFLLVTGITFVLICIVLFGFHQMIAYLLSKRAERSIKELQNVLEGSTFHTFSIHRDLANKHIAVNVPVGIYEIQHEPAHFKPEAELVGKLFFRNPYKESLEGMKGRIKKEGYIPANMRELLSWLIANEQAAKQMEEKIVIVAPGCAGRKGRRGRFVATGYPCAYWNKDDDKPLVHYILPSEHTVYLGIRSVKIEGESE